MKYIFLIIIFVIISCSNSENNDFLNKKEIFVESCQDNIDNDNDGKIDCEDEGCKGYVFCQEVIKSENTSILCQDNIDNNEDGKIDCDDENCKGFTFCSIKMENTATLCKDGIDNDNNGKIDCKDEECKIFLFCSNKVENIAILCQDNIDNDNDGKIDCSDEDCQGFTFCNSQITYIDKIIDLESLPSSVGQVIVGGYNNVGDGGGGLFIFDNNKISINDHGMIIKGWVRSYDGDVNIAFFGAIGDDSTDNTTAIQNAINFAGNIPNYRNRVIKIPAGVFQFNHLHIPYEYMGISFKGSAFWSSSLKSMSLDDDDSFENPAIKVEAQEVKFANLSVYSNKKKIQQIGIYLYKGDGKTADVDSVFENSRLSGFGTGIYLKGRGLIVRNNIISRCRHAVKLDWPTSFYDPHPEYTVMNANNGFRGIMILNNRFHSITYSAVANYGVNRTKLNGLIISNNLLDIGRRIFYGDLGDNALITNNISNQTQEEILELTGGRNYLISNITSRGREENGSNGHKPYTAYIIISGNHEGGMIKNLILNEVDISGTPPSDSPEEAFPILIKNFNGSITLSDIKISTSRRYGIFIQTIGKSLINLRNIVYKSNTTINSIVRNSGNSNNDTRINLFNVTPEDNTTPLSSGNNIYTWNPSY